MKDLHALFGIPAHPDRNEPCKDAARAYPDRLPATRPAPGKDRFQIVAAVSQGLKAMAMKNVPIIALSQLSRDVQNRDDKRPWLTDLRESGQIEQDADFVLFTHREYYSPSARGAEGKNGKVSDEDRADYEAALKPARTRWRSSAQSSAWARSGRARSASMKRRTGSGACTSTGRGGFPVKVDQNSSRRSSAPLEDQAGGQRRVLAGCPRRIARCRRFSSSAPLSPTHAAPIPGMIEVEIRSYDDGRRTLRDRRQDLCMTMTQVEFCAGLTEGHLLKAEKDNPDRVMSVEGFIVWANTLVEFVAVWRSAARHAAEPANSAAPCRDKKTAPRDVRAAPRGRRKGRGCCQEAAPLVP